MKRMSERGFGILLLVLVLVTLSLIGLFAWWFIDRQQSATQTTFCDETTKACVTYNPINWKLHYSDKDRLNPNRIRLEAKTPFEHSPLDKKIIITYKQFNDSGLIFCGEDNCQLNILAIDVLDQTPHLRLIKGVWTTPSSRFLFEKTFFITLTTKEVIDQFELVADKQPRAVGDNVQLYLTLPNQQQKYQLTANIPVQHSDDPSQKYSTTDESEYLLKPQVVEAEQIIRSFRFQ